MRCWSQAEDVGGLFTFFFGVNVRIGANQVLPGSLSILTAQNESKPLEIPIVIWSLQDFSGIDVT
jgi:hypothetical protein